MIETVAQLTPSNPTAAAVERAFSRHVAEHLNGRILRYSQRLEFLNAAQRLRINRFRANLIIAMVQHQSAATPKTEPIDTPRKPMRMRPIITAILLVEIPTLAALWWMCHS